MPFRPRSALRGAVPGANGNDAVLGPLCRSDADCSLSPSPKILQGHANRHHPLSAVATPTVMVKCGCHSVPKAHVSEGVSHSETQVASSVTFPKSRLCPDVYPDGFVPGLMLEGLPDTCASWCPCVSLSLSAGPGALPGALSLLSLGLSPESGLAVLFPRLRGCRSWWTAGAQGAVDGRRTSVAGDASPPCPGRSCPRTPGPRSEEQRLPEPHAVHSAGSCPSRA